MCQFDIIFPRISGGASSPMELDPAAGSRLIVPLLSAIRSILTQGSTLTKTNDEAAGDESTDTTSPRQRLQKSRNDDENASNGHVNLPSSVICNRATQEETTDDRTRLKE